jgi:hypothetical protein
VIGVVCACRASTTTPNHCCEFQQSCPVEIDPTIHFIQSTRLRPLLFGFTFFNSVFWFPEAVGLVQHCLLILLEFRLPTCQNQRHEPLHLLFLRQLELHVASPIYGVQLCVFAVRFKLNKGGGRVLGAGNAHNTTMSPACITVQSRQREPRSVPDRIFDFLQLPFHQSRHIFGIPATGHSCTT